MAINKKLIHFKNKENFEREVANGNILDTSIVFILDTKEIYTHGTIYDGSTFDPSDIETSILEINNRFNISLEYDLVEYPDILDENNNPIFTSVEEGQTLERAINTLEINVATLAQEVLNNEEVVSEALVDTANAVGLDENFHYIQNIDANYISSATSLAEADLLLDLALKEAKEVFIVTSDMLEETATIIDEVTPTLIFTDDGWTSFIEAVEANKIIALEYIVTMVIINYATPMASQSPPTGYFILNGLMCSSAGVINGLISLPSQTGDSPALYNIRFFNKEVLSSVINTPSEIYIIDETMFTASVADEPISSFELTDEYKEFLERAISTNKVIGISNLVLYYLVSSISTSNINTRGFLPSGFSIINLTRTNDSGFVGHVYYGTDGILLRVICNDGVIAVSLETMLHGGGDGTKFLSNDGSYKEVSGEPYIIDLDSLPTEEAEIKKLYDELVSIIPNNKKILLIENEHYITSDEIYYQPNDNFSPRVAITFIDTFNNNSVRILDIYPNYIEVYDKTNFSSFSKEPYIWDGTTSETKFAELKAAVESNRRIIIEDWGKSIAVETLPDRLGYIVLECKSYSTVYRYYINKTSVYTHTYSLQGSTTSMNPGNYFRRNVNSNLTIVYGSNVTNGSDSINDVKLFSEVQGEFSFGDTVYTVTFPSTVKWSTDSILEYKANHTYQFKIVNNLGVMKEFANS